MRAVIVFALALVLTLGCNKPAPSGDTSGASSATASSGSARAAASGAPSAAASAAPSAPVAWAGSYEATPGTLYVPEGKEYEGVKFRGEKTDVALGKGELRLDVPASGDVHGEIDGSLGPGVVSGAVRDGVLTARIDPKEPGPNGFVGTLTATVKADAIEGTMHLSQGEARILREAKFVLKRK